uniref:Chemosensory protein n=1 Tax=Phenacoccus solenopsis TaxID=483260 RepID=A0A0C5KMB6_9HEMI|nr:chemosensory protein [Phenacoccus solenopsis]
MTSSVIYLFALSASIVVSVTCHKTLVESILEKYKADCEKVTDMEPFLKNEKLVTTHVKCLLGEIRCNLDGERIKKAILEVLPDACAKCTEKQKTIVRQVMQYMYKNRQSDFDKIFKIFDPDMKYKEKMMDFMNKKE